MKSVIFDMDGVIVDSEYDHAIADIEALKRYGVMVDMDYVYRFVGTTITHMADTIIKENHMSVSREELIAAFEEEKEKITATSGYRPVEGTVELIHTLKERGHKLAIASSSTPVEIKKVTDFFHISDCFDEVVSGSYVKNPKPAPDIFLAGAKTLGVQPQECLVLEDSRQGIVAAFAAGMTSVFVEDTIPKDDEMISCMNHEVNHLGEVIDLFQKEYL